MDGILIINKTKGNTPVASGSSVPVCPTFSFTIFLILYTISCDV